MQRLHVDDLSGRLLKQGGWELLSIPAIADTEQVLTVAPGRILVRKPGDVLDPEREPAAELENLRRQLGSANFSAQYQQQPIPPEGSLVKRAWIHTYKQLPPRVPSDMIVQSWDCAYKVGDGNDYSACTTWLVSYNNEKAYLIDAWRGRLEYPALVRKVLALRTSYNAALVLIEDAVCGMSLIQELETRGCPMKAVKPTGDKVVRLAAGSMFIEGGNILFPEQADQRFDSYMSELLAFPHGTHDDQVDSTSQFLIWFNERRHTPKSIAGIWHPSGFQPLHAGIRRVSFR
jgi:predicted phage terminase large subunit-like protein